MLKKYTPLQIVSNAHIVESKPDTDTKNHENIDEVIAKVATIPSNKPGMESTDDEKQTTKSAIEDFFINKGITVTEKFEPDFSEIIYLVNVIADSLPQAEEFLHALRKANCIASSHFTYSISGFSHEKREAVSRLATTMRNCGVFCEMQINSTTVSGTMSSAARAKNFISGIWLELYSQQRTAEILKKLAEKDSLPYEVLCNVKVEDSTGTKHEIDLMVSLGDNVFGIELKSGLTFCDYDHYRQVADWMGMIPDHFLLVNSTLTDTNAVKCISYFYQYYICGISDYDAVFTKMIRQAIDG
jgi:hypothetical protein